MLYEVIGLIVGLVIGGLGVALYYERREEDDEPVTPYKPKKVRRPLMSFSDQLDPVKPEAGRRETVFQRGIITDPMEDEDE